MIAQARAIGIWDDLLLLFVLSVIPLAFLLGMALWATKKR